MKRLILFLIFLMIPIASAFDCDDLMENKELCREIMASDISHDEKAYLLSDIIDDLKNFPSHDFVKEHNLAIDTSTPPDDISMHNRGYIRNAWVKTLAIMPSVLEEDVLYVDSSGVLLSAFNHEVQLPRGRARRDCKTRYYLRENRGVLRTYVNGRYLSNSNPASYTLHGGARSLTFQVNYEITVRVDIKHYRWRKSGRRWRCRYSYTEHDTGRLTFTDTMRVYYKPSSPHASLEVKDQYLGTTKTTLEGDDYSSLHLEFGDASFRDYEYDYDIVWNVSSLDVFTVRAKKSPHQEHHNLAYQGNESFEIAVASADDCSLIAYSHFAHRNFPCDLSHEAIDIQVKTDKLAYSESETIHVSVTPRRPFNLTYAGHSHEINGETELQAIYPYNRITIFHDGKIVEKIIHVKNDKPLYFLFSFIIFISLNYGVIGALKKCWGVVLD